MQHGNAHQFGGLESDISHMAHPFYVSPISTQDASACYTCFQTLSQMLCQARSLGRSHLSVGLDMVLEQSRPMLSTISKFLQCSSCSSDLQVFLQALMILQTVFQLYRSLIHPPETSCPQLDIRIGRFSVPGGVGNTVKMLVVIVELGSTKKVLEMLATRVERLPASSLQTEFLKTQTQSLIQELQVMTKELRLPDVSVLSQ